MDIEYKNKAIEKVCTIASVAKKKHGMEMAIIIHQRIDEINAAASVEQMIQFRIGDCHPLKNNRKGQYAVSLVQPHRLIFEKVDNKINIVKIIEIIDYH